MSAIIRVDVGNDLFFLAEVSGVDERPESPPGSFHGRPDEDESETDGSSTQRIRDTVKAAITYIHGAFTDFDHPDELSIEFSIALKGHGGIPVLAELAAESTFKIAAKWSNLKMNG